MRVARSFLRRLAGRETGFDKDFDAMVEAFGELVERSVDYSDWSDEKVTALRSARNSFEARWREFSASHAGDPRLGELRTGLAQERARIGDRFFYDMGACEQAIVEYKSALELDPDDRDALGGLVSVYLQGLSRPRRALPYAVRRAELYPRDVYLSDVSYIKSWIAKLEAET